MTAASTRKDQPASIEAEPNPTRFQRVAHEAAERWTQANPGEILLRLAGRVDLPAMCALNASAIAEQKQDGLFMPMPESFLSEMIRDGIVLILEQDGKVLGYSVAVPVGPDRPAFISETDSDGVGLLFGTAIDPSLRGQGRHPQLIVIRQEIFAEAGFSSVQSTASPFNTASLSNLIKAGFHVVGLKILLDGHPRFLLRREFQSSAEPYGPQRSLGLPVLGDLSEHESLLADGFVATGISKGEPGAMLYTRQSVPAHREDR